MWKAKCSNWDRVGRDFLCRPCHLHNASGYFSSIKMISSNLTISLGVIEKNAELFKPSLPKEKRISMQKMVFGTVNKIFIAYEKPFLHPDITEVCQPPQHHRGANDVLQGDHPVEPCWWESCSNGGTLVPQDIFFPQRFKRFFTRNMIHQLTLDSFWEVEGKKEKSQKWYKYK